MFRMAKWFRRHTHDHRTLRSFRYLLFGLLVGIHEFGHFAVAKLCGVKVLEFALGMGPALIQKQGKETLYSLRAVPFGGYCAMMGEDEESNDPRAFTNQAPWKRILILAASSAARMVSRSGWAVKGMASTAPAAAS